MQNIFEVKNIRDLNIIADKLARNLRGGELIELIGDLGSGKTTFVKALVDAMGSEDDVSSPSFTLSNVYKIKGQTEVEQVWHFDFYRLADAGIVGQELNEVLSEPTIVVIVEWGNTVKNILPLLRLKINFTVIDDSKRQLIFDYPKELQYLVGKKS